MIENLHFYKRSDNDIVIGCDEQGMGGYNVVPKDIDSDNAYDIVEVLAYCEANPNMEVNAPVIEPPNPIEAEITELKQYLADTDYIVIKCVELGLNIATEYPAIHAQRTVARDRINELENTDNETA